MKTHRKVFLYINMMALVLVFGIMRMPAPSHAAKEKKVTIVQLEKNILSHSTQKIEYQSGKIRSKKNKEWKEVEKLPLSIKKLSIAKKGWYTFRVTSTKGKKTLLYIKLKKKTYKFKGNNILGVQAGTYYVVSKNNTKQALEVKDFSLAENASVVTGEKRDAGSCFWQMEPVSGRKFRLKNVNSGLYLSATMAENSEVLTQKALAESDKTMIFEGIRAEGSYYYWKSTATKTYLQITENGFVLGKRKNHKSFKFKWVKNKKTASNVSVQDETYPTAIELGKYFILRGTINSRYTMTSLQVVIRNSAGKNVITATATPNSNTYDIKGIDAQISFGKLTVGEYSYIVTVVDSQGVATTVLNRKFSVFVPASATAKLLPYDVSLINTIGQQSTGTTLEKKACASFALAYCQAILHKTTPSPHTYWLDEAGGDVSCVWARGNYTGYNSYNSELGVLQAAYLQISKGKPCILHVTGNTAQHWLTIVGYKNVTDVNQLTAANLVAIDPWDAKVITVSDKYKIKSTYRLEINKE